MNVGWSKVNYLGEMHSIEFTIAKNEMDAIKKINKQTDKIGKNDFHIDNIIDVDNCININSSLESEHCIELRETNIIKSIEIINFYKVV